MTTTEAEETSATRSSMTEEPAPATRCVVSRISHAVIPCPPTLMTAEAVEGYKALGLHVHHMSMGDAADGSWISFVPAAVHSTDEERDEADGKAGDSSDTSEETAEAAVRPTQMEDVVQLALNKESNDENAGGVGAVLVDKEIAFGAFAVDDCAAFVSACADDCVQILQEPREHPYGMHARIKVGGVTFSVVQFVDSAVDRDERRAPVEQGNAKKQKTNDKDHGERAAAGTKNSTAEQPADAEPASNMTMSQHSMLRYAMHNVFVNDQDDARNFFVDALGFEVARDLTVGDFHLLTVRVPGQEHFELALHPVCVGFAVPNAEAEASLAQVMQQGQSTPVGIGIVEDCIHAHTILEARGDVPIQNAPEDHEWGKQCVVRAPSGNALSLVQPPGPDSSAASRAATSATDIVKKLDSGTKPTAADAVAAACAPAQAEEAKA